MFESIVKLEGSLTIGVHALDKAWFESIVKLEGSLTSPWSRCATLMFESIVKLEGSLTIFKPKFSICGTTLIF